MSEATRRAAAFGSTTQLTTHNSQGGGLGVSTPGLSRSPPHFLPVPPPNGTPKGKGPIHASHLQDCRREGTVVLEGQTENIQSTYFAFYTVRSPWPCRGGCVISKLLPDFCRGDQRCDKVENKSDQNQECWSESCLVPYSFRESVNRGKRVNKTWELLEGWGPSQEVAWEPNSRDTSHEPPGKSGAA